MEKRVINLDQFKPRDYQQNLVNAFEYGKIKRFVTIWPRRSGKDICALSLMVRSALKRVGNYVYCLPTYSQCRKVIWDAIDIDGNRIIKKYIPEEIVESRNEMLMRIRLVNGSQISFIGGDNFDKSLVGSNFVGIVFSEYALSDDMAWKYSIPILKASGGYAYFCSTVRGRNHFYDLYNAVKDLDDWFCELLTIKDTKHISMEEIQREIDTGQMSQELVSQEFFNDFNLGVEGSYYGKYIDDLRRKGQITNVMYEPYLPVHTAWDLGYNDPTVIAFFQIYNNQIRIIDFYQNNKKGLDHYAKIVKEKEYTYGKHIAPFDIGVHDLSTGISRWKMMHDLGITFIRYSEKAPSIDDGIEIVRRALPRMWIDERTCEPLIKAMENYRQEYDHKKKIYKQNPLHDENSHVADMMRYLCVALPKLSTESTGEDIDKRYNQAMYGTQHLGGFFSDDKSGYY